MIRYEGRVEKNATCCNTSPKMTEIFVWEKDFAVCVCVFFNTNEALQMLSVNTTSAHISVLK